MPAGSEPRHPRARPRSSRGERRESVQAPEVRRNALPAVQPAGDRRQRRRLSDVRLGRARGLSGPRELGAARRHRPPRGLIRARRIDPPVHIRARGQATRMAARWRPRPRARSAAQPLMSSRARSRSPAPPTLSIARTRSPSRYQIANAPSSIEPSTCSSSQLEGRAQVLERGPVGEVGEEVGDLVVGDVGAQHVARGGGALGGGHLLVLDAHDAPVDDRVVLAHVAGGVDALGRRAQAAVAQHAAQLAEGQARPCARA